MQHGAKSSTKPGLENEDVVYYSLHGEAGQHVSRLLSKQLSRASNSPRVKQRMGPAMQLWGHWCASYGKLHGIGQASCRPVLPVLLCMLLLVLCMLLLLCVLLLLCMLLLLCSMLLLCMLVMLLVGQTH